MTTVTSPNPQPSPTRSPDALRVRYRIRFAKTGLLRWISHRDLARLWERLLRRISLPLSMTEGFHPKPRVAFPSALPLGTESLDEVVEIELSEDLPVRDLFARLSNDRQPGLTIQRVARLPQGFGKAQLERTDYTVTLSPAVATETVADAIEALKQQGVVTVERKKKTIQAHVESHIPRLELGDGVLHLSLAATDAASLRPDDVLTLLGLHDWTEQGSRITRTRVVLQHEFETDDPAQAVRPLPAGADESTCNPGPSS